MPVVNKTNSYETVNLVDSILQKAKESPNLPAVGDSFGQYSWQQFSSKVIDFSQQISALDYRRIMLILKQNRASVALLMACQLSQIPVVLISDAHNINWIEKRCEDVPVDAIISVNNNHLQIETLDITDIGKNSSRQNILLFTSGTSGSPKCVMHSWNSIAAATSLREKYATKKWACGYSLAQFAGLQVLCQALINGGAFFIPKDFTPNSVLSLITTHKIECLSGTPSYIRQILYSSDDDSLSQCLLEQITLGGEIVDQNLLDALVNQFPKANIVHIYASSEAGAVISVSDHLAGFPAQLLERGDLKIEHGELIIKKSHRSMSNYWGQASKKNQWIHSGDLVERSDDRVYFTGRKSSCINVGGFKVSPEFVENTILAIPEIISVRVSGHKSPLLGAIPKATVQVHKDTDQMMVREKITQYCKSQLADYMIPRIIEFTADLSLNKNQKIQRNLQ